MNKIYILGEEATVTKKWTLSIAFFVFIIQLSQKYCDFFWGGVYNSILSFPLLQ